MAFADLWKKDLRMSIASRYAGMGQQPRNTSRSLETCFVLQSHSYSSIGCGRAKTGRARLKHNLLDFDSMTCHGVGGTYR